MTGFAIANMIRSGAPMHTWAEPPITHLPEYLDGAAFFDLSIPSVLYWQGKQNYYSLEDDFGSLRPPFPDIWAEWTIPNGVQRNLPAVTCGLRFSLRPSQRGFLVRGSGAVFALSAIAKSGCVVERLC